MMSEMLIQVLEGAMLVCFGISWPVDIMHTIRLRRASGKSLLFMALIILGYLAGLASKCLRSEVYQRPLEPVTWLYLLNTVLLGIDLTVSWYFQRREAAASANSAKAAIQEK